MVLKVTDQVKLNTRKIPFSRVQPFTSSHVELNADWLSFSTLKAPPRLQGAVARGMTLCFRPPPQRFHHQLNITLLQKAACHSSSPQNYPHHPRHIP
jgi:hypothetical protein